jgi:Fe-S-cluster containining protein
MTALVSPLSALCVQCGLCCDGTMYRFLPVRTEDAPMHEAHGLPLVTQRGQLAMPLPCSKLVNKCCTVYETRPNGCRGFVCKLGDQLEKGEVTSDQALRVVKEAHRRIALLRAKYPTNAPSLVQAATTQEREGPGLDLPALEALGNVIDWLDAHLHWPAPARDDG